jgi:hypothetical protein
VRARRRAFRLTFGGSLMACSFSTVKFAFAFAPMTIAVKLLGKVRTDTL